MERMSEEQAAAKCARCGEGMEPDDVSMDPAGNICQVCWEKSCSESWWEDVAPLWDEILTEEESVI